MERRSITRGLCTMLAGYLLFSSGVLAGNSKLAGRVTHRTTGEGLAGANVMITHVVASGGREIPLDKPLGAAADPDGYYFILNVRPGVYTVRAGMVGFRQETRTLVQVESDRTITANFQLLPSDVQLEDVVVTAERVMVKSDVSATQEVIATTRIEQMPVLRLDEFVGTIKGVTLVSGAEGNGLSVRGGGIRETDVRLDGISLQDPRTDNAYLALNSTSVQEIQVLTGGFEAKYGGIRSGLLNVVSKDGHRDRFTASFKADYTPPHQAHFFGTNPWSNESWIYRVYAGEYAWRGVPEGDTTIPYEFRGFKGWANPGTQDRALDSVQKLDLWNQQHPQYPVADQPDVLLEGSITGPFPGGSIPVFGEFAERTTFLLGFRYENSRLAFPIGPRNNYLDWNGQLKLTTVLNDRMRLSVNGLYANVETSSGGRSTSYGGALMGQSSSFGFLSSTSSSVIQQARLIGGGSQNQMFNKSRLQLYDQRYLVTGAKFTHLLSDKSFYTIDFQYGFTDQNLQPFAMDTSRSDQWLSYFSTRTNRIHRYNVPIYGSPNASTNYGFDPLNTFAIYGGPQRVDSSYSRVYQLKGDVTTQIGRHHQVEAGISARLQDLFVYTGTWFQSQLSYTPDTWQYMKVTPLEIGAYVQDKLEFEGMILNAGLRLDVLDPMKQGYSTTFPLPEDYAKFYADIYQNLQGTDYERWVAFRAMLDDPPGWPKEQLKVQTYVSPRLGVSFPITESSKLYFNYGHFYQRPPISFMYNTQLYLGSTGVPTPDLDMARTIAYEFGYEQMLFDDLLVNVTAYYKDIRGEPLSRSFINYYEDNIVSKYYPDLYRDVRGVELRLERPFGRFVTFFAMYDYMIQSSGQSGLAQVYENRLKAANAEVRDPNIVTTEPRPRASINLNLHTPADFGPEGIGEVFLGNWFANFLFEWRAGSRILLNPEESDVKLRNYVYSVDYWNIDFRGSKLFETPYGSLELVVTIQNLTNNKWLNTDNMLQTQYSDYKASLRTPDKGGNDKWGEYKKDYINVGWWQAPVFLNPRRITLGLRLNL